MKNKTPLIFGGIFAVLLVVYLLTTLNPPEKTKGAVPLFPGEFPVIDKLVLTSTSRGEMDIEMQDGVWNITSPVFYKASTEAVELAVDVLLQGLDDGIVTSQVDAQKQFGLDDETAFSLAAYSGDEMLIDVLIGNHSTDLTHTYVRLKGSNDIHIWRGALQSVFNRDVSEWRDRAVYSFNPDDVLEITAVEGKNTRRLAQADTLWTYTENGVQKPVDQAKVMTFVTLISNLNCDVFADDADIPRAGTTEPQVEVSFTVRNGDVHTFSVWVPGESDAGRYLVRKKNGDSLYRFYQYRGEYLVVNYEKLKP